MVEGLVPNDPGWRPVVRKILPWVIMPGRIGRLSKDGAGQPPVFAARAVFLSFVLALVMFLVVLLFILPLSTGEDVSAGVYLLLAAGPVSVAFVPWARRRLLGSCGSRTELSQHYATSFFLGIAFAELAALLGFVAAFLAGAVWPYVVGMLVSFVGFGLIAPTASQIRRLDESLSARGCTTSLRAALYTPTDAGTGA